MVFAARACSRATRTAERICASCAHFSDASLSRPEARACDSGNKDMWTLSGSPTDFGKYFQISSEVKTRIGAMRRTKALDFPDRGLRRAAGFAFGRLGVEAIFQDVEIEGAQVHDAEVVDGVVDAVEFVNGIPVAT